MLGKEQAAMESALMQIYYDTIDGGWSNAQLSASVRKSLGALAIVKKYKNLLGRVEYSFKLTELGLVVIGFLRRKMHRVPDPGVRGMVFERRVWSGPHIHSMGLDEAVEAAENLGKVIGSKVEVFDNWAEGQKRIIFHDLEECLVRAGVRTKWDRDSFIEKFGATERAADLFVVLSKQLKEVRDNGAQTELIIW